MNRVACLAPVLAVLLAAAAALPAQRTIHVDVTNPRCPGSGTSADPFCKVQDGIRAAANGDTVLVRPGTYKETLDLLNKAITVRGERGPAVTILDGGQAGSVVSIRRGEGRTTVLTGFTIQNGTGSAFPFLGRTLTPGGGGIICEASSPTLTDLVFRSNTARWGAGLLAVNGGSPLLTGLEFHNNWAVFNGAGACFVVNVTPTVRDCVFRNNSCGHTGGAVNFRNASTPTFINCVFARNTASDMGGAIRAGALSSGTLLNCTFYGNSSNFGGALAVGSDTSGTAGLVTVTNCVFFGSTAGNGNELSLNGLYPTNLTVSHSNVAGGKTGVYVQSGFTLTWGQGMITANPGFVDATADDFHLLHTSPCRDQGNGNAAGLPQTDFEGDPRVVGRVDMGADEFAPHLYHVGKPTPGGSITIRVVGAPGMPAAWVLGGGILEPPLRIPGLGGLLRLSSVAAWVDLGRLPTSGVHSIPVAIPSNTPRVEAPTQSLVGTDITNLDVLSIR